jgi:hypothetical protein
MAQASLDLIDAMRAIAAAAQPITGRGVGYKLFVAGLIESMGRSEMKRVYRLLLEARERGIIPWEWIVDETRALERTLVWDDADEFVDSTLRSYRRDWWLQQPCRVEVWSEKGTVRGVLQPVLREYAVGFRVMHGFGSGTVIHDIAEDDERPLVALYIGDYDPSGMWMSERDLPERLERYDGDHVELERVALLEGDLPDSLSFPASEKKKDSRYKWFVQNYGTKCWEIDAMDPNVLRTRVEGVIRGQIDMEEWERCVAVEKAERESLRAGLYAWRDALVP